MGVGQQAHPRTELENGFEKTRIFLAFVYVSCPLKCLASPVCVGCALNISRYWILASIITLSKGERFKSECSVHDIKHNFANITLKCLCIFSNINYIFPSDRRHSPMQSSSDYNVHARWRHLLSRDATFVQFGTRLMLKTIFSVLNI